MITKISMENVACFKNKTTFELKKVNLVYGLNGTGKSTISNYLYLYHQDHQGHPDFSTKYSCCSVEGIEKNEELLVYNQLFIEDNFHEQDNLKGIFTLSKENKDISKRIEKAKTDLENQEKLKEENEREKRKAEDAIKQSRKIATDVAWSIKTNYSGGDRVLEYCLKGLMSDKSRLFEYLLSVPNPLASQPRRTIEDLKYDVEALKGDKSDKYDLVPKLDVSFFDVEENELFKKPIVGSEHSTVAKLISELGNSDWVKDGLNYLPEVIPAGGSLCPFCQQQTITEELQHEIKAFFDKEYENDIKKIEYLKNIYDEKSKIAIEFSPDNHIIKSLDNEFQDLFRKLDSILDENKRLIIEKLKSPSQHITLKDSSKYLKNLNDFIDSLNDKIKKHNTNIDNKDAILAKIRNEFWGIMKVEYTQTLSRYEKEKRKLDRLIKEFDKELMKLDTNIKNLKNSINELQKKTVNLTDAIDNINNGLRDLGIDSFSIELHENELYRLVRDTDETNTFHTLSEGEKTIISFLYFLELYKGRLSSKGLPKKKIVVIDDPISSLSHIFVFNVGRMINDLFLKDSTKGPQVIVLTHSLYFYYELANTKKYDKDYPYSLLRIDKNQEGSQIIPLRYNEIQNTYQSYWSIIKNNNSSPALMANCMRNIVEYFFGFVEKLDLNGLFQKGELNSTKYQAFYRYLNRESHSDAVNIYDYNEFDHEIFKEGFKNIFCLNGYEMHYNRMMK